jgi:hypothetical protein
MNKPLPIGIDNFEKVIKGHYYYVDKTKFICDLLAQRSEVNLFTRPRRFGKSLNMSMLQSFFERKENASSELFKGLKIMDAGKKYLSEMHKYPVIAITLKGVEGANFHSAAHQFKNILKREYNRHGYLFESSKLGQYEKAEYQKLRMGDEEVEYFADSLRFLSECLELHHQEKVVILIDEYDVPLEQAYFRDYYNEMVNFIRLLFGNALKSNSSLAFAVLTGCLRVSKESIFTGLNNLDVNSIVSVNYGEYFGFTEDEMKQALVEYQLETKQEEMKLWYNGYYFGEANVYNPWSAIKYLRDKRLDINWFPEPYWSNTSSNSIIRELIEMADGETKVEIESLIRGESIEKPVFEDIVYAEIKSEMNNLWNFLFFTGYLKKISGRFEERQQILTLKIPNEEVLYIYERKIREWFNQKVKIADATKLLNAIMEKDIDTITSELNTRLMNMISFYDSAENFYHGFLTGILGNIHGFRVKSNREAGKGRSALYLRSTGIRKQAVIFECKALREKEDPKAKCKEALLQIEEKKYEYELREDGYKEVLKYAVVFQGKECMVAT